MRILGTKLALLKQDLKSKSVKLEHEKKYQKKEE